MSIVDVAEGYFERSRFQQPQKIRDVHGAAGEAPDFDLLYNNLGVSR
jgi:hypothetical protein